MISVWILMGSCGGVFFGDMDFEFLIGMDGV